MDRATWAALIVVNNKLNRILNLLGDDIMAALDEVNASLDKLEASADAIVAKVNELVAQGTVDPAAAQAVIDRINGIGAKLDAVTAPPA